MSEIPVYTFDDQIDFTKDDERIYINTKTDENIIELARKDREIHSFYKKLVANDYVHYYHANNISKLHKRKTIGNLFKRKDLQKLNSVYYTLDQPKDRKVNNDEPKRLLVIFSCMPPMDKYDSHLFPDRMFTKFFDGIEKNLVKNVHIMRIMDLNCSHGSHYISTTNYPNFEKDIQESILAVMEQLNIKPDNTVLYGVSKGGTGSIYHGTALDLKSLAVDPILNIGGIHEKNDHRFLKDLRKEDLIPTINNQSSNNKAFKKVIICSEKVKLNYEEAIRITEGNVQLINMIDNMITSHPEVSRNSVPEQLMILNRFLSNIEV